MTPGAQAAVEAVTGTVPVCHPDMPDLHPDMSSAAAEIYAASVALGEFMHLSYINDEMGLGPSVPCILASTTQRQLHFLKTATSDQSFVTSIAVSCGYKHFETETCAD